MSHSDANPAAKWHVIGTIDDIPRQGARIVKAGETPIAIFRTMDDQIFAFEDSCAHEHQPGIYCPLSQGITHGASVACPIHNWVICLETGQAQGADEGSTNTYPIRLDGQTIHLQLTPQTHSKTQPQTQTVPA